MADDSTFRQTHDAMHAGATRPLHGPASIDTLAASGGLEVRGAPEMLPPRQPHEPIPGEREPDTLLGTQPGAVGGIGFGAGTPVSDLEQTMDERTAHEHLIEGGGADSQRTPHEERQRT